MAILTRLSFKDLAQLNKSDIACIAIRLNSLASAYQAKVRKLLDALDKDTLDSLATVVTWFDTAEELDPFIGEYTTTEADRKLLKLTGRAIAIKSVRKINSCTGRVANVNSKTPVEDTLDEDERGLAKKETAADDDQSSVSDDEEDLNRVDHGIDLNALSPIIAGGPDATTSATANAAANADAMAAANLGANAALNATADDVVNDGNDGDPNENQNNSPPPTAPSDPNGNNSPPPPPPQSPPPPRQPAPPRNPHTPLRPPPNRPRRSQVAAQPIVLTTQPEPFRQYRLDSNTPIFGLPDCTYGVRDWIFIIENGFKAGNVPDNLKLQTVSPYIRGNPFQSLARYMRERGANASWNEFSKRLIDECEPHDLQDRMKIKLKSLRQSDSFDKYVQEFRTIINKIENISIADQILWFREGLAHARTKLEVANAVTFKRCTTLEEAIVLATNVENCMPSTSSVNYLGTRKFIRKGNNFHHKKNLVCRACGKVGHYAKNCFSKNKQSRHKKEFKKGGHETSVDRRAQKPKTIATCYGDQDSILKAHGSVNGFPVVFSLDCGAVESIISNRLAMCLKLALRNSSKRVKTATNEVTPIIGETNELEVVVGGNRSKIVFLVLDMDDHDVLLGLDWLIV